MSTGCRFRIRLVPFETALQSRAGRHVSVCRYIFGAGRQQQSELCVSKMDCAVAETS